MAEEALRLSDKDVQNWALGHLKSTPAQLARAYGVTYDLLQSVLDTWMDHNDKTIANLAAEICVQNYVRAKRNNEKVDILILCKAVEKLRDNLFSTKFGVSLRAARILGNVIDEYSQRKITIKVELDKSAIDAIKRAAEMDGDTIIDITEENGTNEGKGEERPLLLGYTGSGIHKDDGQELCITQEISGQMHGATEEAN